MNTINTLQPGIEPAPVAALWLAEDVAKYLVVGETAFAYIERQPGFPKPIVLPSRGTGARQLKRWDPADIRAWIAEQKKVA
jgi:predicted DNA-binding transcriptional regulator AlpA